MTGQWPHRLRKKELRKMIDAFQGAYRWLSNFEPAQVVLDGDWYNTVEHAYQAAKTLDPNERRMVAMAGTPNEAKKAGRLVGIRNDWEDVKDSVMLDLLRQKFHIPHLRAMLLNTEEQHLIEGNWWGDTYWGVCRGNGRNRLGELLMKVRDELRREQ